MMITDAIRETQVGRVKTARGGWAISSDRTTIWNKEKGSYCVTMQIEWQTIVPVKVHAQHAHYRARCFIRSRNVQAA